MTPGMPWVELKEWTQALQRFFKDKGSKTVHADVVSCKGPQDLRAVDVTVHHMLQLGSREVVIRVHTEKAAKAL